MKVAPSVWLTNATHEKYHNVNVLARLLLMEFLIISLTMDSAMMKQIIKTAGMMVMIAVVLK